MLKYFDDITLEQTANHERQVYFRNKILISLKMMQSFIFFINLNQITNDENERYIYLRNKKLKFTR